MKSFEQFLEDAPVRTYNDSSVIASPEQRRRAGRREIEKDYVDTQDTQAAVAALRKPDVETEKEKKFGMGSVGTYFDKSGAAGTKEDDRKPLSLRPKRTLATKNKFQEMFSEKEGIIPKDVRNHLDEITKDREGEDDKIQNDRFKNANTIIDSISGKHPLMDILSAANSTVKEPKGFQKRLQSLKELIDNDDEGDDDENLNPLVKMRMDLKGKTDDFIMKMDDEGYNLDNISNSDEFMSDANVEEGNDISSAADFIPKYARQINKALKGLPNVQVGDFLNSIDVAQKDYKDEYEEINMDKLRNIFDFDDEVEDDDELRYEGLNTSWSLSPESMEDNFLTAKNDDVADKNLREVAWNDIVSPGNMKTLADEIRNGKIDDSGILELMFTTGNKNQQQRITSMMNDYIEKSGSPIKDALTPEGLEGFEDYIRKVTALDARKTWRDQIMPDLKDGEILRNTPMYGGRGGNARERIYKQAGFGELLEDDYQYGQKKDGEKKLKPLDEDDLDVFDEDSAKEEVMDSMDSYLPDELPFERWDFEDAVKDYFYDRDDFARFRDDPDGVYQEIYDNVLQDAIGRFDASDFESYVDDEMIEGIDKDEFKDFAEDKFNDISQENQIKIMTMIVKDDGENLKKIVKSFIDAFKEAN
tara:strand:- start:106 stop:2037 length:1932 start_codon:yes stop_codon:yes gene_type:complete